MNALEEVHRTLALQEFRRRRDKIALDNVRLGRIVSTRTTVRTQLYYMDVGLNACCFIKSGFLFRFGVLFLNISQWRFDVTDSCVIF